MHHIATTGASPGVLPRLVDHAQQAVVLVHDALVVRVERMARCGQRHPVTHILVVVIAPAHASLDRRRGPAQRGLALHLPLVDGEGQHLVAGLDDQTYVFTPGDDGEMVGTIEHEPTVAFLLQGGLFYPADPGDYEAALRLAGTDDDEPDDDKDDDEASESALPVEANTPPVAAPARRRGRPPRAAAAQ